MKNSARGGSSTGSELKAVEEACREASRTVEPCELCGHEKKFKNHQNRKICLNEIKILATAHFVEKGFFLTTCGSVVNTPWREKFSSIF